VQFFADAAAAGRALGGGPILLAVSRRSSFFRTIALPNAARSDLKRLLEVQAASIFPLPVSELAYDFQQTDETGPEGRTTLVAAMPGHELVRAFEEVQSAGFTITKVIPTAMGSPLVAASHGLRDAVIAEKTAEGLCLDVVTDGLLRVTRIALADSDIEEEARRAASLVDAIDLPLLDVSTSNSSGTPLSALVGPQSSTISLDLEPRSIQEARDKKQKATQQRFALLMAVAAVCLVGLVWADRSDAEAKVAQDRTKMNASVSKLKREQQVAESDALNQLANQEVLNRAFKPAQPLSDLVVLVTSEVPPGLWITGISVERGKSLSIRGTATSSQAVATYLDKLGRSERLRDVRLVFSNNATIEERQVVQFSIASFPVGNLPLSEPSTRRRT
jgi:Tfp pilus assembly protein PilN